jgi:hypothetical protein
VNAFEFRRTQADGHAGVKIFRGPPEAPRHGGWEEFFP